MKKKLRSGYTTGACAAAAAKAAVALLLGKEDEQVVISLPDGRKVSFAIFSRAFLNDSKTIARASVIKDAGDDPDITNGAEIAATVRLEICADLDRTAITIHGGHGVGIVTKPGLAVEVGQSAINPIPLRMIEAEVFDLVGNSDGGRTFDVEISVPNGVLLAKKTLNERLGIIGGISILGTTGIVRPISAEAWTATITTSMQVARANGQEEIVLSTGRTSERAVQELLGCAPESLVMMGDYLEFSLTEAKKFDFARLHISGMWAKIIKAAMEVPHTHVRFGALEMDSAIAFVQKLGEGKDLGYLSGANTAREIYERLVGQDDLELINLVCQKARNYQEMVSALPVTLYLVHHDGTIVHITG